MDCHSNHSVFLRANGSLACWDDAGSRLTLKDFDPEVDYSKDVVFGEVFGDIRASLQKGEMPFPEYCRDCLIMASGACFNPQWQETKEIKIFQVESSIACTLECPGCMTFAERKMRHGRPWHLDIEIFEKYLKDFKNDGVTIRVIDFQGHGEPMLNKDVWKMAALAREYFPEATVSMCTASHGRFEASQVSSGITEMMFAIDGVDQASFEPNRVRGNFEKAFGYMKSFCQGVIAEGRDVRTIWKYILFDCNSAPEQLLRAQELAAEAGVQELHFVNTQLGVKLSKTFTLEDIPRLETGVTLRISDYLSNFNDIVHSIDKARFALSYGEGVEAGSHLLYAANMIRRRFECIEPGDSLPDDYQAVIHEVSDLVQSPLVDDQIRQTITGGFHAVSDKLTMDVLAAKSMIIGWKSEEIARLNGQLAHRSKPVLWEIARLRMEGLLNGLETHLSYTSLPLKNRILRWKTEEVHRLAVFSNQQPGPGVSVM